MPRPELPDLNWKYDADNRVMSLPADDYQDLRRWMIETEALVDSYENAIREIND